MVTVHFATVEDVKARLNGTVDGDVVDRRLDHNVADQLAIALFANRAFLVEGTTESAVFYGIGDRTSPAPLRQQEFLSFLWAARHRYPRACDFEIYWCASLRTV